MSEYTAADKSSLPSVLRYFEIIGMHGYRNVSFRSDYATAILIAQNGAGKTTLLNAIDAVLRGQFLRLRDLRFQEIRFAIGVNETEYVISSSDIKELTEYQFDDELVAISKSIQVDPLSIFSFLLNELPRSYQYIQVDDPIFESFVRYFDYNVGEAKRFLENQRKRIFHSNTNIATAYEYIDEFLRDVEIIYLPTYRRIESPLSQQNNDERYRRRRRQKFKMSTSMFSGDIQFGLADISERLFELNQEIVIHSNRGYRKLTSDIISELIDGSFDRAEAHDFAVPSPDELSLFFARLREGGRSNRYPDLPIPNIGDLGDPSLPINQTNRFLRYFLAKLRNVMDATKGIETEVESFIDSCNNYLGNNYSDDSVSTTRMDSKELILNRTDLSVEAVSIPTGRSIALDALSSGEKQIISLFAKIYLYPKQKLILIDEPELSLSIEWQKHVLPDIISSRTCQQLIAITHSPFVFDNELEPFAKSLNVSIQTDVDSVLSPEPPAQDTGGMV